MVTPEPLPKPFIPLLTTHATLDQVGGKGFNLIELARAGFPVTNAFLIPTECYREFVKENHLDSFIQDSLDNLDPTSPEALSATSAAIRTRFEGGAVSPRVSSALEIAWRWLGARPMAVRSSATAEDLPELSFAGQQDTFLNVIGDEPLLEAVVKCWSSLWTARAIGYRARNNIPHRDVALCVIVQNMVPAQASGVMFTANPLSGRRSETVIDATLGLGEALVGGRVQPDHYVVAHPGGVHLASARHLDKSLGSKSTLITGKLTGGVEICQTDASPQQALDDEVILQLAKIGKEIEALYNFPQDIEWAYLPPSPPVSGRRRGAGGDEGGLYILQSRPITSLFPLPENLPPEPLRTLIGLHVVQGMLEPFTPLGLDTLILVLTSGGRAFGLKHTIESQNAFFVAAERLWINITPIFRSPIGHRALPHTIKSIDPSVAQIFDRLLTDPRLAPLKPRLGLRTAQRLARFAIPFIGRVIGILRRPERRGREILQTFEDIVAETRAQQVSSGDMWADFVRRMQLLHEAERIFPDFVIPHGIPPVVAGMAPFFGILERFSHQLVEHTADQRFRTLHMEISRGVRHNVTTEMDLALWQTAQTLRRDSVSRGAFEHATAPGLAADFLAGGLPPTAQRAVSAFLDKYGARGLGEIDIGRPRWYEDPIPVMQVLQSYLQIEDPELAPDVVFASGAQVSDAAIETLVAAVRRLPGGRLKARLVRFAAGRYRALGGLREAPKFFAVRMIGMIRQGLLASGKDFVKAGLLDRSDDLFFLYLRELEEMGKFASEQVGKSVGGQADESVSGQTWASLREKIGRRRAARAHETQRKQIPRVLLSDGMTYYEGVAISDDNRSAIVGDPVSPGVAEGVVRVVLDPHRTQLEPGEILVCPGTDPAWTPLFLAAGGLVMEVGGMMTHGSVVAREYGIPAVVGVHQATTRLQTGQRVRVNGSSGIIEVVSEQ